MKGSEKLKKPRVRKLKAPSNVSCHRAKVSRTSVPHDDTNISPMTIDYKQLFERSPDAIAVIDLKGVITSWNPAAMSMTGFSKDELNGKHFTKLPTVQLRDIPKFTKMLSSLIRGKTPKPFEVNFRHKDGSKLWGEVSVALIKKNGKIAGIQAITRNITDRKRLEQSLEKERQETKLIIDSSPIIVFYKDKKGRFVRVNRAFAKALKIPEEKFLGKTVFDFYSAEIAQGMTNDDQEVLKSGRPKIGITEQYESANGTRWVQTDKVPIFDQDGIISGLIGFARDITERKTAEEALRESEGKYRSLVERANYGICIIQDKLVKYSNPRLAEMWGGTVKEIIDTPLVNYVHPDELPRIIDRYNRRVAGEQVPSLYEIALRRKDNSKLYAELNVGIIEYQGKPAELLVIHDLTERKQIEWSLRKNERRLKEAERLGRIGNWEFDVATQKIEWSDEVYRLYERDKALGPPTAEEEALYYSPEEAGKLREFAHLTVETGKACKYDVTANLPSGMTAFFHCTMRPIKDDKGQVIKLFGTVQDITERKQAEQALQESEERYRLLVEFSPDAIYMQSEGKIIFANSTLAKLLGTDSVEQLLGKSPLSLVHPDYHQIVVERMRKQLEEEIAVPFLEEKYLRFDGTAVDVEVTAVPFVYQGKPAFQVIVRDITERKQAEEALRQSEQKYHDVIEGTRAGIVGVDTAGKIIFVNKSICDMLGYPKEHLLGKPFIDFIHLDDKESVKQLFFNAFVNPKGRIDMETRVINEDGELAYIQAYVSHMKVDDKTTGFNAVVTDITSRKQAEEQYKTIVQVSIDGFWIVDMEGRFLDANDAYCKLIGYSYEELLNMSIPDIEAIDTKEEMAQRIQRIAKTGEERFETQHRCKDGRIIDVEVSNNYIDIGGGRIFVFIRDITGRKAVESELVESRQQLRNLSAHLQYLREQERTNLAREIHDELGQALTALKMDLSWLQSRLPEENGALRNKAALMSDVINSTMETVRRMSTELRPGLLDDLGLIAAMEWQATEFTRRTGIKCKLVFKPEEIAVEQDMATAFFRIFQEVLTNVARHSQATKVTASFKEKSGTLELMVSDNGRGITQEEASSSKSLGLTGIRERVFYLGGTAEIKGKPGKGTTVKVRIARSRPDDKDISG